MHYVVKSALAVASFCIAMGLGNCDAAFAATPEAPMILQDEQATVELSAWPRIRDSLLGRERRPHRPPPPPPPPPHHGRYGPPPPPRHGHRPPPPHHRSAQDMTQIQSSLMTLESSLVVHMPEQEDT